MLEVGGIRPDNKGMAIRTNTNKDALNSINALRRNQGQLTKAFERLSSGLRINMGPCQAQVAKPATPLYRGPICKTSKIP